MAGDADEQRRVKRSQAARAGAIARAAKLSPERRREIAQMGAIAKNAKHDQKAMARRGGKTIRRKRGRRYLGELSAAYRREHPSDLEIIVMGWLDEMGVSYRREEPLESGKRRSSLAWVDFYLPEAGRIVEVNGQAWHVDDWHGQAERKLERYTLKRSALRIAGWPILELSEAEIRDGSARGRLEHFARNTDALEI